MYWDETKRIFEIIYKHIFSVPKIQNATLIKSTIMRFIIKYLFSLHVRCRAVLGYFYFSKTYFIIKYQQLPGMSQGYIGVFNWFLNWRTSVGWYNFSIHCGITNLCRIVEKYILFKKFVDISTRAVR